MPPPIRFIQHFAAGNIGRHQVGCELDALVVQPENHAHRVNEQGLCKARHADEQRMAARKDRHKRLVDHLFLTVNHFANGLSGLGDLGARGFDFLNGVAVRFTDCLH